MKPALGFSVTDDYFLGNAEFGIPGRRDIKMNDFKIITNLWGVIAFALIGAVLLHEIGHMLTLFILEKRFALLWFHPFQGAHITYATSQGKNLFISAGGILFGGLLGGLITLALWRFRRPYILPLLLSGAVVFGINGLALLAGTIFSRVGGDVAEMIVFGMPKIWLGMLGSSYLCCGFILFLFLQPDLGIRREDGLLRRCLILLCGLLPYALTVLIYNGMFDIVGFKTYVIYVTGGLVLVMAAAGFSQGCYAFFPLKAMAPAVEITWGSALFSCGLGVAAIIFCFVFLQ